MTFFSEPLSVSRQESREESRPPTRGRFASRCYISSLGPAERVKSVGEAYAENQPETSYSLGCSFSSSSFHLHHHHACQYHLLYSIHHFVSTLKITDLPGMPIASISFSCCPSFSPSCTQVRTCTCSSTVPRCTYRDSADRCSSPGASCARWSCGCAFA